MDKSSLAYAQLAFLCVTPPSGDIPYRVPLTDIIGYFREVNHRAQHTTHWNDQSGKIFITGFRTLQ